MICLHSHKTMVILNATGTQLIGNMHCEDMDTLEQLSLAVVYGGVRRFLVFTAIFNNISIISGRSVLLLEEIVVDGENHRPFGSH